MGRQSVVVSVSVSELSLTVFNSRHSRNFSDLNVAEINPPTDRVLILLTESIYHTKKFNFFFTTIVKNWSRLDSHSKAKLLFQLDLISRMFAGGAEVLLEGALRRRHRGRHRSLPVGQDVRVHR